MIDDTIPQMRDKAAAWMLKYRSRFQGTQTDAYWAHYLQGVRNTEWADGPVLQATAEIYNLGIDIYSTDNYKLN